MSEDHARAARGSRALNELTEVEAAFETVKAGIIAKLCETPFTQPEKVLKLHLALDNLSAVKEALQRVIDDGTMAQAAIAQAGLTRPN